MGRPGARWVALAVGLAVVALVALVVTRTAGDDDGGNGGGGHHADESTGAAAAGGSLVVAVDADPGGLDPTRTTFSPAGLTYALAVFDPLMAVDDDGTVVPYLAESLTADDDHLVWTLQLRPGVTFTDGSPLNSAAIVRLFDAHLASELHRPVLRNLESIAPKGELTVELRMKQPWVAFPAYLTGQLGLVAAPAMLDDPDGAHHPIGTGPFVLEAWTPGDRMTLRKNDGYWQKGLPHLDALTIRAIPDDGDRADALASGAVDLAVLSEPSAVHALDDVDDLALADADTGVVPERQLVFNTAAPPFDDVQCRLRVAAALDHDGPDSPDPEGCDDLAFTYRTSGSPDAVEEQLSAADIDVTVERVDPSTLELDALLGHFEAVGWVRPGVVDPDQHFAALDANSVGPIDTVAANVGRFADDDLQAAFDAARGEGDAKARAEQYDAIDELLAARVPLLTLGAEPSTYAFAADVGGVLRGVEGPDGEVVTVPVGTLVPAALHRTRS